GLGRGDEDRAPALDEVEDHWHRFTAALADDDHDLAGATHPLRELTDPFTVTAARLSHQRGDVDRTSAGLEQRAQQVQRDAEVDRAAGLEGQRDRGDELALELLQVR